MDLCLWLIVALCAIELFGLFARQRRRYWQREVAQLRRDASS